MFRSREKKTMNPTKMPYLVFSISVFVAYFGHFSAIPLSFRFAVFSLSLYIYERATVGLKLPRIALKRPEMLRTYHK